MKYAKIVVAVSGGVDSMCLLDMLTKKTIFKYKEAEIVVAHFDHGIRQESSKDRKFVEEVAKKNGFIFEYAEGKLGKDASEEKARISRYAFLEQIKDKYLAEAIMTAHHLDDVLETAIINMIRGTGPRGLCSLQQSSSVLRPLLNISKQELVQYALLHSVEYTDDCTNHDQEYLRNYVRITVIPRLENSRSVLLNLIDSTRLLYGEIDDTLMVGDFEARISKSLLPYSVACELMAQELRKRSVVDYTNRTVDRLVIFSRTANVGSKTDVDANWWLIQNKTSTNFVKKTKSL